MGGIYQCRGGGFNRELTLVRWRPAYPDATHPGRKPNYGQGIFFKNPSIDLKTRF
jgi:hypothetical protein